MADVVRLSRLSLREPRRGLLRGTPATAWHEVGCALEATDPGRAMAAYQRAIAGRPDLADAHNNLGRIHHEFRHENAELGVAESCYRIAICLDPTIALYWFNLGVVVEDQGRCSEAIAAYERAIELDPSLQNAHFNVARLLELAGRRRGDDDALHRAIRHLTRYRALVGRCG